MFCFLRGEMGKREKQKKGHRGRVASNYLGEENDFDDSAPVSSSSSRNEEEKEEHEEGVDDCNEEDEDEKSYGNESRDMPSKFLLYQQSVQVCGFILKRLCLCQWAYLVWLVIEMGDRMLK